MLGRNTSTAVAALILTCGLVLSGCEREATTGDDATDAPPATAAAPPRLSPGLWRVATTVDGMEQEASLCLDAAVQEEIDVFGAEAAAGACQESSLTPRPGGGLVTRSVCDMGQGGRMVSEGTVTGDFSRAYRMETTVTTTGAAAPQMNGVNSVVSEARLDGACPSDMRPGDMRLPGGMTVNMVELSQQAARMGAP